MSLSQRKNVRFSLDLSATLVKAPGNSRRTEIQQISVGGCLTGRIENIFVGDEFRLEIDLPNGNRLPLECKAIYRFDESGIGARFIDITQFEQELVAKIIKDRLENEGMPVPSDDSFIPVPESELSDLPAERAIRPEREDILDNIMRSD